MVEVEEVELVLAVAVLEMVMAISLSLLSRASSFFWPGSFALVLLEFRPLLPLLPLPLQKEPFWFGGRLSRIVFSSQLLLARLPALRRPFLELLHPARPL